MRKFKTEYRKRLPHFHPIGATFFITFRLHDSIPYAALQKIKTKYDDKEKTIIFDNESFKTERISVVQQEYFKAFDELLHKIKDGPVWLKEPAIAQLVADELRKYDGLLYTLLSYCIMSNHVHVVFDTSIQLPSDYDPDSNEDFGYIQVNQIMKRIKGATASRANKLLGRTGSFWARESHDRYMRNEQELRNRIFYTVNNPVKAGLVKDWQDWPFTYWLGA